MVDFLPRIARPPACRRLHGAGKDSWCMSWSNEFSPLEKAHIDWLGSLWYRGHLRAGGLMVHERIALLIRVG